MSVRSGLATFGISASVIGTGFLSAHEAIVLQGKANLEKACLTEQYAGEKACQGLVITDETIKATVGNQKFYDVIASVAIIGGSLGVIGAYFSAMADSKTKRSQQLTRTRNYKTKS